MFAKPVIIKDLPTHFLPHFDEALVCFMLWNFPHPKFVGADEASVSFYNAGRTTPDGQYATEQWIRKHRQLPIGIWGGVLDEHRRPEETDEEYEERKKNQECAASLAAKLLGIDQLPELQSILRFARRVDNTATADPRDISSVIKKLHDNRETEKRQVVKWVKDPDMLARIMELLDRQIGLGDTLLWIEQGIYAKYCEDPADPRVDDFTVERIGELLALQTEAQSENNHYSAEEWLRIGTDALELDQLLFQTVTAEEYRTFKIIVPFRGKGRGGEVIDLKIAVVPSDDVRIHRYARSKLGDQVAVTIQRRRNGSVAIQSNKWHHIRLHDAARSIITEEALLRGLPVPRWEEARRELTHNVWFYFTRGEGLFNGAKTSPDVDPTRIPLQRIVALVKMALSIETFEPLRSELCLEGECASTKSRPCPWYKYGFSRCQTIRWEAYQARQAQAPTAEKP